MTVRPHNLRDKDEDNGYVEGGEDGEEMLSIGYISGRIYFQYLHLLVSLSLNIKYNFYIPEYMIFLALWPQVS